MKKTTGLKMEKFNPGKVLGEYNTEKLIASINETNWNLDDDPEFSSPPENIRISNSIDNYKDEIVKIGVCLSSGNQDYNFLDNQKEKEIFLEDEGDWEVEFSKRLDNQTVFEKTELELQINVEDLISLLHFLDIEIDQYNILPLSLQNKVIIQKKNKIQFDQDQVQSSELGQGKGQANGSQIASLKNINKGSKMNTNPYVNTDFNSTTTNSSNLDATSENLANLGEGELFQYIIKTLDQGIRVKKKFSSNKKVKVTRESIGLDYHVINSHIQGKEAKDSIDLNKLIKELIKKGKKYKDYSNQLDLSEIEF